MNYNLSTFISKWQYDYNPYLSGGESILEDSSYNETDITHIELSAKEKIKIRKCIFINQINSFNLKKFNTIIFLTIVFTLFTNAPADDTKKCIATKD